VAKDQIALLPAYCGLRQFLFVGDHAWVSIRKSFLHERKTLFAAPLVRPFKGSFYKELIEELCSVGVTDQPSIVE
jgi:hypothetical protein